MSFQEPTTSELMDTPPGTRLGARLLGKYDRLPHQQKGICSGRSCLAVMLPQGVVDSLLPSSADQALQPAEIDDANSAHIMEFISTYLVVHLIRHLAALTCRLCSLAYRRPSTPLRTA